MEVRKILKSFEALRYKSIAWLPFFPRRFCWGVRYRPRAMARHVERERGVDVAIQFDDALSPPMLLMLAVLLAYVVHLQVQTAGALSHTLLGGEQTLLRYRAISLAIWPLIAAIHALRRGGARLTRETMRRPC